MPHILSREFRKASGWVAAPIRSVSCNLLSTEEHKEVVEQYIEEVSLGRIVGPITGRPLEEVHISPFGVIPKKTVGKWRLITDLSSPQNGSVNETISEKVASLHYVSVDSIAEVIVALQGRVFMGKGDIKEAYRLVPIHPEDTGLLGMRWEERVYIDVRLPFGLRSAPKIFTAVADAFQWVLLDKGIEFVFHYVDDFIVIGRTREECEGYMSIMEGVASNLGIQMEPSKREGPSRVVTYLGSKSTRRQWR